MLKAVALEGFQVVVNFLIVGLLMLDMLFLMFTLFMLWGLTNRASWS